MGLFSNGDEPFAPDWYLPTWPDWLRQLAWKLRNPFHDLSLRHWRRPVINPIYIGPPFKPFELEVQSNFVLRFRPFFLKVGFFFIGWRSDKPNVLVWPHYGPGGGAFDVGFKDIG